MAEDFVKSLGNKNNELFATLIKKNLTTNFNFFSITNEKNHLCILIRTMLVDIIAIWIKISCCF